MMLKSERGKEINAEIIQSINYAKIPAKIALSLSLFHSIHQQASQDEDGFKLICTINSLGLYCRVSGDATVCTACTAGKIITIQ
jgi:hypothetical protein